ncbi:MAG TPA: ABC transporter ATP-binding protein [Kiritimatiellae bacterium]|nr:ABC transporter ATP-binding protein [Kiritimatiellia bacterium]
MHAVQQHASAQQEPVVILRDLSKVYRDFWRRTRIRAVQRLSVEVFRGEVFGLLGPNGSGKTTTLKMLVGLLHPTSGSILILGRTPRSAATRRILGYLPEESPLYPFLSAREALDFYARLFNLSGPERRRRVDQLLEMTGLTHVADRPIGQYSHGMVRRVGLAQALINDPDIIVLDEPTAGMDPLASRQVKDILRSLADQGRTVILSSHLLADVEDICDRIAVLYNGRLRAVGTVEELLVRGDRLIVSLPAADADLLQKITGEIRRRTHREPDISHPRRNLEDFFLDLIRTARDAEASDLSGAGEPGQVAEYLDHYAEHGETPPPHRIQAEKRK